MTTYWTITTHMPGYLPENIDEPFEATDEEALDALLDEADFQLDGIGDYDDADENEAWTSDVALFESYRRGEGRADLLAMLRDERSLSLRMESYANGFGGYVTLDETREDEGEHLPKLAALMAETPPWTA